MPRIALPFCLLLLLLALLGVAAMSLTLGAYPVNLEESLPALFGEGEAMTVQVIQDIRLPRILGAILVGAALAAAGAAYQLLFRNPLVSPDILGVSAGAGLGAVLGLFFSLPMLGVQGLAFAGGVAAVLLVIALGKAMQHADRTLVLVLTGVVLGALAGAVTSLLKILADPYDQLPAITFWLLGSLSGVTMLEIFAIAPVVVLACGVLYLLRWRLNVLSLPEHEAQALGVPVKPLRITVIALATVMTSAVVAVSGVIGWIGLLIPHAARLLVGPSLARLLPTSILMGALFLLLVDTASRSYGDIEVPLGILTALVGAPFFLGLLLKKRGVPE
ncbi:FecCD family ABC transporter permease [Limnobacter parvus]|uniref:Iron ABC transporter permease n=1 Tax=Limnobacter parvus TaxID=2939690 RepID=A0ABT1XKK0_9BURK|nr:iron ABC transporter permease [Limnobacter parvus]MCR2747822.1 iron ABC transporter permease [Limnobacter parvus]